MADTQKLGQVALDLIDDVVSELDPDAEHEVGPVMLLVELANAEESGIFTRCSDDRTWVQLGMVESALAVMRARVAEKGGDD